MHWEERVTYMHKYQLLRHWFRLLLVHYYANGFISKDFGKVFFKALNLGNFSYH
jgi:hypothetical protein